jgi:nitroreductase
MQLAAWELGIGSCLATIYEPERARSILGFPADIHLHVALSFGYPADPEVLTAPPRRGGRRAEDTVVHRERWASPPDRNDSRRLPQVQSAP